MTPFRFFLPVLMISSISSCTTDSGKETSRNKVETTEVKPSPFIGTFVSEGYQKKSTGADWVSVTITQIRERLFHIEVRSRANIKKPTCSLTSDAQLTEEGELFTSQYNLDLGFRISGDKLLIYSPSNRDLNYFCSGGATLAGKYKRTSEKLPEKQVDQSQFWKFLEYPDFTFTVQAIRDTLTIQPVLPKGCLEEARIPFTGSIADADIADLDADGFPEIYVYVREGKDQRIRLVAYNLNKGKSLSQIHLQEVTNQKVAPFKGRDEFKPVEGALVRRYPIEGTKKTQQVQYVLKMGEALPQLVIDKVYSF
ncbi:hypothetical protein [Fluviicola sp.]|uniref:hypothetical protein n=1 Tax=Fluviicola sp. TaxID=1917219 RepID=UPI003D2CE086